MKFLTIALLLASAPALAAEPRINLQQAPGVDVVENNCQACHSLDYIPMNSPIQDRDGWQKTVQKMVDVLGAPITPEDQKTIVEYLAGNYGKAGGAPQTAVMGR